MRIVEKEHFKKYYEKITLEDKNNLPDRPTEFIRFMSNMCKKYKLSVDKIAETNKYNRSMGMALNGEKIIIQIYFNYDMNELELVIFVDDDLDLKREDIRKDIMNYVTKVTFSKGDKVTDNYGDDYILKEDILEATHTLKSYKAIRISDNVERKVYNSFIVPMFKV